MQQGLSSQREALRGLRLAGARKANVLLMHRCQVIASTWLSTQLFEILLVAI